MTAPHVLVTRPAGQHEALVDALRCAGVRVSHMPALTIEPLTLAPAGLAALRDLDMFSAVIFISVNAARIGLAALRDLWSQWPVGIHWLAVGEATAAVLSEEGLSPEIPPEGYNSEALLALDCLRNPAGQRILILAGEQGRPLLAETLSGRGAEVDVLALYRRGCATFRWPGTDVDAVLVTSLEGWQCIAGQVPPDCLVIAGSERIGATIRASGRTVVCAASPHDGDMLAAVRDAFAIR